MEIIGKVIEILPTISGVTEKGEWSRGGFVVETMADYPVTLALETKNEKIEELAQPVGVIVKCLFSVSSHKSMDKWYTKASLYRVEKLT